MRLRGARPSRHPGKIRYHEDSAARFLVAINRQHNTVDRPTQDTSGEARAEEEGRGIARNGSGEGDEVLLWEEEAGEAGEARDGRLDPQNDD